MRWIDVTDPTPAGLVKLQHEFHLHPLVIENMNGRPQPPKLDDYGDYLLVVLQFPIHRGDREHHVAAPVAMLVGANIFISAHGGQIKPLNQLVASVFDSPEAAATVVQSSPAHIMYEIVDRMVDDLLPMIPHIVDHITRIGDLIFDDPGYRTVQEISYARRDLISLLRIVRPQLEVVTDIENSKSTLLQADLCDYWGNVADRLKHFQNSLEELQEALAGLSDTHDTMISNRMNDIMKALTIISVVMLPLTLITGWFGMNVPLPYQDSGAALIVIAAVMLLLVGLMLFYFRKMRWI
jgi:magnesium transporter